MRKIFNKFNIFINLWISFVINVVLCIALVYISTGTLNLREILVGFAIAYPISTLFCMFVPVTKLGENIAIKLGARPMSIPFRLISTAVLSLIVGTLMSMLMVAVMAGKYVGVFTPAYFGNWLHVYPWALLSVYLSALLGVFTAFPLALKLFGPPPRTD